MKKKVLVLVLVAALVVGGVSGVVYANSNSHVPMTGQKLVGYGFYDEHYLAEIDGTLHLHTLFVFTNPDCVSDITIEQVSIFAFDGVVLYEGFLDREGPVTMEPHEANGIELQDYIGYQDLLMPVTVEIYWTGAEEGLPLTGWAQTGHGIFDKKGRLVQGAATETQMVNMKQILTTG